MLSSQDEEEHRLSALTTSVDEVLASSQLDRKKK